MSNAHYFDQKPTVASERGTVSLALPDVNLKLATDRGVFSYGEVDAGTRVLLQHLGAPAGANLLDLGCGYGPIALTMAKRNPASTVWAVDTNERAVALCAENAAANGCKNVRASLVDGVPAGVRFDAIWSNPPIRIGKAALHAILLTWLPRLSATGVAHLVVQKHLGSDSLAVWLETQGYTVKRETSRFAYRVLAVRPEAKEPTV